MKISGFPMYCTWIEANTRLSISTAHTTRIRVRRAR